MEDARQDLHTNGDQHFRFLHFEAILDYLLYANNTVRLEKTAPFYNKTIYFLPRLSRSIICLDLEEEFFQRKITEDDFTIAQ